MWPLLKEKPYPVCFDVFSGRPCRAFLHLLIVAHFILTAILI
ncbi:hypothetical protein QUC31_017001 [Theobroma cacao]